MNHLDLRRLLLLGVILLASTSVLRGQVPPYMPAATVTVAQNGSLLADPFTGGLELPQFQAFDLDGSAPPDLLVFDRIGQILLPYTAEYEEGGIRYRYAPQWQSDFPALNQLLLIGDINCDGLDDLISTRQLGSAANVKLVAHLQSVSPGGERSFHSQDFQLLEASDSLIRIHALDIPALADINGDDALDLLYIPIGGTRIQYYENVSASQGSCDSLAFVLADDCWGDVSYQLDGSFSLNDCGDGFAPTAGCAGSALLAQDFDADGDQDLYFSSLYEFHIRRLRNVGDATDALLADQQTDWIREGNPLVEFPAAFSLAGLEGQELIIASNRLYAVGAGDSDNDILRFVQPPGDSSWNLVEQQFLRQATIDLGFRSNPTLWDLDQDGLLDIIVGYNRSDPLFAYRSGLAWYRNTGTATEPAFQLMDNNLGGLYSEQLKAIHPAFGDLDGDGEAELVTGLENGQLWAWKATAEPTGNYELLLPNPFAEITVDALARPQLVDADQDGLLDLLCGSRSGISRLWLNEGSTTVPQFYLAADTLGGIIPGGFFQENSPFLHLDESGLQLFNGQRNGLIQVYALDSWDEPADPLGELPGVDVGERTSLALGDLNDDGEPDLIIGNMRGGLQLFLSDQAVSDQAPHSKIPNRWQVYPNPVNSSVIYLDHYVSSPGTTLSLYDSQGRLIRNWALSFGQNHHRLLLPKELKTGIYFLHLKSDAFSLSNKLLIQNGL